MTISVGLRDAADGYEVVQSARTAAADQSTALFRRSSARPSKRAVLHVHASRDPDVPSELSRWYTERAFEFYLVRWYTERAFQFYLAPVRLPSQLAWPALPMLRAQTALPAPRAWSLRSAFEDLDAACAHLREAEGMNTVIVTAHGQGALAAALWADARQSSGADALILHDPVMPAHRGMRLSIACPVLVLTHAGAPARAASLGSHVTWLQLAGTGDGSLEDDAGDLHELCGELGRWLGAYMYGRMRDRLL